LSFQLRLPLWLFYVSGASFDLNGAFILLAMSLVSRQGF